MKKLEKVTKEIIYLQRNLSVLDWKYMRNVMFPDYYNKRLVLSGLDRSLYKLKCIKQYVNR